MRVLLAGAVLAALALAACSASPRAESTPAPSPSVDATPSATPTAHATAVPTPMPGGSLPELAGAARALTEGRFEDAARDYAAIAATATTAADPSLRSQALLGEGIARHEDGDREGAIEALRRALEAAPAGSVVQRRAGYLLALRLGDSGDYAGAAALLQPFASEARRDALQPYLVAEHARAARRAGNPAAAMAGWTALLALPSPPTTLAELAFEEQAEMAKEAGDTATALAWLSKLATSSAGPAVRYELATMAHSLGDSVTFAAQLRAIIASSPGSKEAVLAIADLRDAGYEVDRGEAGLVYYRRGAYAEARAELLEAIEEPGLTALDLAFRLYYLGAAYEDGGQPAKAVAHYDAAAATAPTSPYAHKAKYWAARSVEATGDHLAAAARYAALVRDGPTGDFTSEAAFRAGYELYRGGDRDGAIAAWDSAGETGGVRALYWKGRALLERHEESAARAAFERAANLEPWGFYGIEAARELGRAAAADVRFRTPAPATAPNWDALRAWLRASGVAETPAPGAAEDAIELMAMGLRPQATAALLGVSGGADPWRLLELARQAHDLGLTDVCARFATRLRDATHTAEDEAPSDLLQLAYPVGYVELLNEQASSAGLDPLFVAAMVRQESFWDPNAGSRAGALGLTQVIPSTGEGIARALGVAGFEPEHLFRPGISLQFGIYYLAGQLHRFGSPYAALAAYNAGPGNALRWTNAVTGSRPADFVEAIDISETHDYVERVMDHYAHYVYAYR